MADSNVRDSTPPRRCRVLIVDDNAESAELLALLIEFKGHETCIAFDGPTALAAADHWRPDAVVLDIGLPGMSGYDVCRQLRSVPWGASVFIIAITGWALGVSGLGSLAAGFDAHLVKPVDHAALNRLLSDLPCGRS